MRKTYDIIPMCEISCWVHRLRVVGSIGLRGCRPLLIIGRGLLRVLLVLRLVLRVLLLLWLLSECERRKDSLTR